MMEIGYFIESVKKDDSLIVIFILVIVRVDLCEYSF